MKYFTPPLYCYVCSHPIKVKKWLSSKAKGMAIAECSCCQYPVINGIYYLKQMSHQSREKVLRLLQSGNYFGAMMALVQERKKLKIMYYFLLHPRLTAVTKHISFSMLTRALTLVEPTSKPWFDYLKHRFQRVSHYIALHTTSYIKKGDAVLDVGCGLGHFLHVAGHHQSATNYVGADISFSFLLLARRYLVDPPVPLVCADLDNDLPFAPRTFNTIYFNDSFMYFKHQQQVLVQLAFTLKQTGLLFLNHVHQRGYQNLGEGHSLSLSHLRRITGHMQAWINSDKNIFTAIFNTEKVIYRSLSETKKVDCQSFSVILTKKISRLPFYVPPRWLQHQLSSQIDFTEEDYLH